MTTVKKSSRYEGCVVLYGLDPDALEALIFRTFNAYLSYLASEVEQTIESSYFHIISNKFV